MKHRSHVRVWGDPAEFIDTGNKLGRYVIEQHGPFAHGCPAYVHR